jgi:hypothetical protein
MIDRDKPHEVAAVCVGQIDDLAGRLKELVELSANQIRNAYHDRAITQAGGDLDEASRLVTEWANSDDAAALDRIVTLAGAIQRAARPLAEVPLAD